MKLVFGQEQVTAGVERRDDADNVWGPSWHAFREGGGYALEYDTGDLAGRQRRFVITADEFARLRADPEQFEPIIHAHGG